MSCPLDYSLCCQTVTVYHRADGAVRRQVLEGCHLEVQTLEEQGVAGKFLLIVPGQTQTVFPGDRIMPGQGPETLSWRELVPGAVEGLLEAAYAKPCYWQGQLCHTEAGR